MTSRKALIAVLAVLAIVMVMLAIVWRGKPPVGAAPEGEFLSTSAKLNPGWQLYTMEGHQPVGLVKMIESDHLFPDGKTQEGVLILLVDATEKWVTRAEVNKLYVAKP